VLEELFQAVYHCKVGTLNEAWSMPVHIRKWWIRRTTEEMKKESGTKEKNDSPAPWSRKEK